MSLATTGAAKALDKQKATIICFSESRLKFILFSFSKVYFADFTLSIAPIKMSASAHTINQRLLLAVL